MLFNLSIYSFIREIIIKSKLAFAEVNPEKSEETEKTS